MTNTEISNADKIMLGDTEALAMYIGSTPIWLSILLPYDAEIEYLESSGTQYINTNIISDENTGLYIKCLTFNDEDQYLIGIRNNDTNTRWCIGHSPKGYYYGYGSYWHYNQNIGYYNEIVEIKLNYLNCKNTTLFVNNENNFIYLLSSLSFEPTYPIRIFGSSGVTGSYNKAFCKIYAVQITQGNEIILDLIPVRKDGIGYMYDKVSKQLFGNQGSGEFVLGPDL